MRGITVLAIANRLGANQALGDMVERVARVPRIGEGQERGMTQYSTNLARVPCRDVESRSPDQIVG